MPFENILNNIFSARSNVSVMRVLKNHKSGISGREIARLSSLSPKACLSTLTHLENIGVVQRVRGGREHFFTLNRKQFSVGKIIIPALDAEKYFFESVNKDIKHKIGKKCLKAYLFGSVARGEAKQKSDFDICIVTDNKTNKPDLNSDVDNLKIELYEKYFITLSPFYISDKEFEKRARLKKPPVYDILKEGILLFNN